MDRFLMHVNVEYPRVEDESSILRLVRGEELGGRGVGEGGEGGGPVPQDAVFEARKEIHQIHVAEAIEQYIVALIDGTRFPGKYSDDLDAWIDVGSSPRGGIALDKCSRAHAWLQGEEHVTPDNVRAVVHDVLRHRLMLSYKANASGVTADAVIDELLKHIAVA
jgi:MoxR-like ATPase